MRVIKCVCVWEGAGGNGGKAVFGCTGPLRPERCAGVGTWGREVRRGLMWCGGGQSLKNALRNISMSLQNSFFESHNWRLVS